MSVRSALEMLGAACALHPAFAEAEILEVNNPPPVAGLYHLEPAGRAADRFTHALQVNGLFRHGFLLAPAMATRVADAVLHQTRGRPMRSS